VLLPSLSVDRCAQFPVESRPALELPDWAGSGLKWVCWAELANYWETSKPWLQPAHHPHSRSVTFLALSYVPRQWQKGQHYFGTPLLRWGFLFPTPRSFCFDSDLSACYWPDESCVNSI